MNVEITNGRQAMAGRVCARARECLSVSVSLPVYFIDADSSSGVIERCFFVNAPPHIHKVEIQTKDTTERA
jgi:hypothetical protein